MNAHASFDLGALTLRVALGVVFLVHGLYLKVMVFGVAGTVGFFESLGLPAFAAWAVIAGETLGGLALIAGVATRWAALGLVPIALGATWTHWGYGWLFSNAGGGWEFPLFLAAAAAAQALIGAGSLTLPRLLARRAGDDATRAPATA